MTRTFEESGAAAEKRSDGWKLLRCSREGQNTGEAERKSEQEREAKRKSKRSACRGRSIESCRVTGYTEHRCERHHETRHGATDLVIQHNLTHDHRTYTLAFDIGGGGGSGSGGGGGCGGGVCVPVGR